MLTDTGRGLAREQAAKTLDPAGSAMPIPGLLGENLSTPQILERLKARGHVCPRRRLCATVFAMSTLAEIEIAADALPPEEKQELILFLATRLRGSGVKLPPPRKFSKEQLASWIADDEAEMMRFKKGASGRPSLFGLLDQRFSGNA